MKLIVDHQIFLETIEDHHAAPLYSLVQANRDYLAIWLPWVENVDSIQFIKNFIAYSKKRYANHYDFPLVMYKKNTMIGRIGLYDIDHHNGIANIGYWLGEKFQGKGYMSSCCRFLISYAFEKMSINRIEIKCAVENRASQAIPERLNFTREGIIRQGERHANGFVDLFLYSLLREEWLPAQT